MLRFAGFYCRHRLLNEFITANGTHSLQCKIKSKVNNKVYINIGPREIIYIAIFVSYKYKHCSLYEMFNFFLIQDG